MIFRHLRHEIPPRSGEVVVSGAGAGEEMAPGIIDRPGGTGDRLLMFFPGTVELDDGVRAGGTLVLWREGAGHFYGNREERWRHSWTHFHGRRIAEMLRRADLEEEFRIPWQDGELLETYLYLLYRESVRGSAADPRLLENHLLSLFLEISRRIRRGSGAGADPGYDDTPVQWIRLRRYIENHLTEPLTLEKLSRVARLSPSALSAGFRRYFGTSPIRFQLDRRVDLARYLLRDRNLSVKEIAERCGSVDQFQFSRLFRRRTGVSPREFRRRNPAAAT